MKTIDTVVELEEKIIGSLEQKGDSLFFKTVTLTDKYVPSNVLEKNFNTIRNKEIRWRHVTPESNASSFLGVVNDAIYSKIIDKAGDPVNAVITTNEIFGSTPSQKKAQQIIRSCMEAGDGVCGVSAGFVKLSDDDGQVKGIHMRELSLTPKPKCKECGVLNIKGEVLEEMSQKPKEGTAKYLSNESATPKGHQEGGARTSNATSDMGEGIHAGSGKQSFTRPKTYGFEGNWSDFKELGQMEVYDKMNKNLENRNIELEVLAEELGRSIEDKDKKIEELEDLLSTAAEYIEELEIKNEKMSTIPLRLRIADLKGIDTEEGISEVLEKYEEKSADYLLDLIEELEGFEEEAEEKPETKTQELEQLEEKQLPIESQAVVKLEDQEIDFESLTDPDEILKAVGFSDNDIKTIPYRR